MIFALLNMLIMKGKKIARILYWLVFILEIGEFYFPMVAISEDSTNYLTYIALMLLMLLKLSTMARFGSYLNRNKYSRVLFDHVLEILPGDDISAMEEIEAEPIQEPVKEKQPVLNSYDFYHNSDFDESEFETEEIQFRSFKDDKLVNVVEEFTFPQLAIRLAVVVYGSLAGFPILTNILSEFLCSTDGKVVFAIKDIFMLCILSSVLWTFAVLFLYYDHPKSKTLCNCCITGELVGILFYLPKFLGYMHAEDIEYPTRVFILFVFINIIRYALLAVVIKPIYLYVEEEPIEKSEI